MAIVDGRATLWRIARPEKVSKPCVPEQFAARLDRPRQFRNLDDVRALAGACLR
jgi:hypothetical protein